MRLLWEESGFELVGAFCVAAFSLAAAWLVLESMFGLNAVVAGLFAAAVAGGVLEGISRRHYAGRRTASPRRPAQARGGSQTDARSRSAQRDASGRSETERSETQRGRPAPSPSAAPGARTYAGRREGTARGADSSRRAA